MAPPKPGDHYCPIFAGGRGLWIARQMSDLTITTTTAGTSITAAIPRR
jgi:hypothetical protein